VGGLLLRRAAVRELVDLVQDEQVEAAPAAPHDVERQGIAARLGHGLAEGLAAGVGLTPAAGLREAREADDGVRVVAVADHQNP
jgi:hypothetical protein